MAGSAVIAAVLGRIHHVLSTTEHHAKGEGDRTSWEVHVTRGTYHMDEDAPPSTVEEWLAYAHPQPDLKVLPAPDGRTPEVIFDEGGERGEVSIIWEDGRVSAWNPYERSIGRMVRIAREIGGGAHCEDDDGKRGYDEQGNFDPAKVDPPEEEYQGWLGVAGQATVEGRAVEPAASTSALVALLVKKAPGAMARRSPTGR